ncbi:MAG: hypothetical protein J6Y94_05805, partial [Bacteriovoracaceae bacterium]|nr:hypothetical protein [Bacteriovoracaceae bacterium]
VKQEIVALQRTLQQILDEKKDGKNDAYLEYLKTKLAGVENFKIVFPQIWPGDQVPDPVRIAAAISPEKHLIMLTPALMDYSYTHVISRQMVLAHELGHLLSISSYIGHRGTHVDLKPEYRPWQFSYQHKGHKFAAYTVDNYPFWPELQHYADLCRQEFGRQDSGYCQGLAYLDVAQRPAMEQWAVALLRAIEKVPDIGGNTYQLVNWIKDEYNNFEVAKLGAALILNNGFNHLFAREEFFNLELEIDQETYRFGEEFARINSRLDEMMADHFAIAYLQKIKRTGIMTLDLYDTLIIDRVLPNFPGPCNVYDSHLSPEERRFLHRISVFPEAYPAANSANF